MRQFGLDCGLAFGSLDCDILCPLGTFSAQIYHGRTPWTTTL
jgi:hypothetical protein